MCTNGSNIEPVARAICRAELLTFPGVVPEEIDRLVDRFWPVIASQIVAGLRDENGVLKPHSIETGIAAWERWLEDR